MPHSPYRLVAATPSVALDPYHRAWTRLRRLRTATVILSWSSVVFFSAGFLLLGLSAFIVLVPMTALMLRMTFGVSFFPCPRCDDWFKIYGSGALFSSSCAQCGIKVGTH